MLRSLSILLFVLATLPMAFVEPFVGLLLWVLFSYMNPYREAYGFAYGFRWVLIIAAVTLFSMLINRSKVQRIEWTPLVSLLLFFLIATGISSLFAVMPDIAVDKWIQLFKVQIMVFATLMLVNDRKRMHWMVWVIVLSFGLWAVKGGLFTLIKGGAYHVYGPGKSFYGDNNQFALVMCMTLPLMRYLQVQARARWLRTALWVLMALTVLSILGTYSRGGLITLLAVLVLLVLRGRKRFGILIVVLMAAPLVFNFLPQHWKTRMAGLSSGHAEKSESFEGRLQSWEFATNVALHRPLTGGGFGVWASSEMWSTYGPPGAVQRAIHSIWFQVLGEQGFVGLLFFVSLLILGWRNLSVVKRRARDDPQKHWLQDLAGFMQVSMVAYVVSGSALPQAYFDFIYQLLALTVLLRRFAESPATVTAADRAPAAARGVVRAVGR